MKYVLDASVALKWVLPEPLADNGRAFLHSQPYFPGSSQALWNSADSFSN